MNATEQVEAATAARDEAKRRLDALRERETKLLAEIDDLADRARSGKAGAGRPLVELSGDVGSLRVQLGEAESALTTAERELTAATTAARRARFDELVIGAREAKADFVKSYRSACVSLGTFCVASQELDQLTRILGLDLASRLPTFHEAEEASTLPDPRAGFLVPEGEHEVWRGWNYQLSFYVSPLVPVAPQGEN